MKLTLQIALGVFLGTLSSQLIIDTWRSNQTNIAKQKEERVRAEQEKVRQEQGERIRALLLQNNKHLSQ
ncbi:MAG: hypothetical protein D0528_01650 [Methylococcales bacterium]|nr:MAG: hypothetical protein D0528_01650 [Methylococcales bacterium]